MSSTTGNRCAIFDALDALDNATTLPELIARLKPILNELAYYAVTSEGAVMDTREEWHNDYTAALHEEMGTAHVTATRKRAEQEEQEEQVKRALAALPSSKPKGPPRSIRTKTKPKEWYEDQDGRVTTIPRAPPKRAPPSNLSSALRAIMEGTHSSFTDTD